MGKIEFVELKKNRFGRLWGIKVDGKVVKKGYRFDIGNQIFNEMLAQEKKEA